MLNIKIKNRNNSIGYDIIINDKKIIIYDFENEFLENKDFIQSENGKIKFIYNFKDKIHDILYDEEEIIPIECNEDNKKLEFLFYLSLLITDNKDIINYSFPIDYIREINDYIREINKNRKEITKEFKLIIMSKIINDLIYNYIGLDTCTKEDIEELEIIKNENKEIIINNLNIFKNIGLNLNINDINKNKIDKLYVDIINTLIEKRNFENYEYAYNIIKNLELEKITITKTMYEEIRKKLNENEIINYYKISDINDLFDEKKINFYYILLKYILKKPMNIYDITLLSESAKKIKLIISKHLTKESFSNINKDIRERLEYIIKFLTNSEYYFDKFFKKINCLKDIIKYNENSENTDNYLNLILNKEEHQKYLSEILTEYEYKFIFKNKEINSTKEDSISYRLCLSGNENKSIKFLRKIGENNSKADYVKQLNNGMFISGGGSDLIIYDKSFEKIKKIKINNNNIYENKNDNNNNVEVIICSNDKISLYKIINGNIYPEKTINEFGAVIYLKDNNYNSIFRIGNKEGLFILNDYYFYNMKLEYKKLLSFPINSGINIIDNIIALTSIDKIILFHLDKEELPKIIEGYSPTSSINNIALLPYQDNKNYKYIICACKKNKKNNNDNQTNGILLICINLNNNSPKIMKEDFEKIEDFKAYCFCPISFITYITNKQKNEIKKAKYFLVGGFDTKEKKGLVKLFEILADNDEIKISFKKDIKFNDNNSFQGFNSTVTCIIQTNNDNKILITCDNGEVLLFEIGNILTE